MSAEMCVNGICHHPKHIQGTGFVPPITDPIVPVLRNNEPKQVASNLIKGDEALKIKAEYDKNNYLVNLDKVYDSTLKGCTRR